MLEEWNARGETGLPDELVSRDIVTHFPRPLVAWSRGAERERVGPEIALPREAFPDQRFEEQILIAEGDMVFVAWDVTGTHLGPLYGREPTGKEVTVHGADVVRLENGKIVGHWDYYTKARTHALARLGLLDLDMQEFLLEQGLMGRGRASGMLW